MLRRPVEYAQYTSEDFQRLLADQGIICSMSRRGECWINVAMESFSPQLKIERVFRSKYKTHVKARATAFDAQWIEPGRV